MRVFSVPLALLLIVFLSFMNDVARIATPEYQPTDCMFIHLYLHSVLIVRKRTSFGHGYEQLGLKSITFWLNEVGGQ